MVNINQDITFQWFIESTVHNFPYHFQHCTWLVTQTDTQKFYTKVNIFKYLCYFFPSYSKEKGYYYHYIFLGRAKKVRGHEKLWGIKVGGKKAKELKRGCDLL